MSSISPSTLLASRSELSSPTSTHIQDTQSSHSENHQQQQQQQHNQTPKTTEYKSNFKPFDQYVYNEITDSFVKHKSPTANYSNTLLIESASATAAGSNQDLNALSSISPALEISSFEPNNGGPEQHYDVTKEPWYKEVVRRNEKANEYRFKSEVGHSSPLLKQADDNNTAGLSNDELSAGSLIDEQQRHAAATSPTPPTNSETLSSRRSYNFTAHDYKRSDHLIATMANNNNFKLPKEEQSQQERSAAARRLQGAAKAPRTATSSPRPLARTTASSRARSQTSRTLLGPTPGSIKAEPASKSNQSSPVKSATPRAQTTRTALAAARSSLADKATKGTPATSSTRTSARPSQSLSSNSTSTRPSTTATRRAPPSGPAQTSRPTSTASKSIPSSATTRPTTTTTNRASTSKAPTLNSASRLTTARTPSSGTTGSIGISSNKSRLSPVKKQTTQTAASTKTTTRPSTAALGRNSLSRAPTSRSGSTSGSANNSAALNEPKSIKSKALADAGEKAAALAAASLAATGGVATLLLSDTQAELASTSANEQHESATNRVDANKPHANTDAKYYLDQEANLITTTTEKGNMLADEIARAEKVAQEEEEEALRPKQEPANPTPVPAEMVVTAIAPEITSATNESQQEFQVAAKADQDKVVSEELVNGLSGGIVSAEDTYDHSERDSSAEFASQQVDQSRFGSDQEEQNEADDDQEPYSLMPTTFNTARQEEPLATQQYINEAFSEQLNHADYHLPKNEASNEANNSAGVQYEQLTETKRGDESRHVEFDLNIRTKSADSLHETEIIESRSLAKLNSGRLEGFEEAEKQEAAVKNEDSLDTVEAEQLSDEPYEHLEPETEPKAALDEAQARDNLIDKQAQDEHDERIDDGFEIIESEAQADCERKLEPAALLEPENLAADETEDRAQVQDEKLDEFNERNGPDSGKPEEEEENDHEALRVKPDLALAEEPLVIKTIDVHELTEEVDMVGKVAGQVPDKKLDGSASAAPVFVPQSADLSDIGTWRGRSSDTDDQQARPISAHPKWDFSSSQTEGALVYQVDDDKQVEFENKTSASRDHEEGAQVDEMGSSGNELLMNVADLVEAETRAKEEMARKSELARQQSNSRTSLPFTQAGEILLSADQLNEQLAQSAPLSPTTPDAIVCADYEVSDHFGATSQEQRAEQQVDLIASQTRSSALTFDTECDQEILSIQKLASLETQQLEKQSTDDLVNFGSITPTQERPPHGQFQPVAEERRDLISDHADEQQQQQQRELVNKQSSRILDTQSSADLMGSGASDQKQANSTDHWNKSNTLPYDDLMDDEDDDDEQQKLSNHLTNSDDDAILAPRNTKETLPDDCFSPQKAAIGSRYNEGAGLSSVLQQEEEAFDGSESAAIEAPTVAENRVQLATSKSLMPELHAVGSTAFLSKLSSQRSGFDSDDDDASDLALNPSADPIDVAATLSPSSSMAEEMLRLGRQASNGSMTGGAVSKLAEELRSNKLSSDWCEMDAETYTSGGTSAAQIETQLIATTNQVRQVPDEANQLNNNNNEIERRTSIQETEETRGGLVQRKASADLGATYGDRKETEAATGQPEDSSGQLDESAKASNGPLSSD